MPRKRIKLDKSYVSESWEILKQNKAMYFFPVLSLVITAALVATFVFFVISDFLKTPIPHAGAALTIFIVKLVAMLLCLFLIPLMMNVVNAAIIFYTNGLLKQEKYSIGQAFGLALKRLPSLAAWSLVQVTLGFLLNLIDNTHEVAANLVIDLIFGVAWGLISFFVLPVVLLENKGVFQAIKESIGLIKQYWGRRAVIRFGIFNLTFMLLCFVALGIVFWGVSMRDVWSFPVVGLGVLLFFALGYTAQLVGVIMRLKIYDLVKEGEAPAEVSVAAS